VAIKDNPKSLSTARKVIYGLLRNPKPLVFANLAERGLSTQLVATLHSVGVIKGIEDDTMRTLLELLQPIEPEALQALEEQKIIADAEDKKRIAKKTKEAARLVEQEKHGVEAARLKRNT
jgi:hypothetical protein